MMKTTFLCAVTIAMFLTNGLVFAQDTTLTITNAGRVGIGTMSPAQKLDVLGTIQMTGFKMPTSASSGYVLTSNASGVGTWQPAIVSIIPAGKNRRNSAQRQ